MILTCNFDDVRKVQEDESFWKVFISFFNELDASGPTMSLAEDTQEESPFSKISTSVMAAVGDHLDLVRHYLLWTVSFLKLF